MNPLAQKYGAPQLPQVNLVPKGIGERRAMRAVQTFAALALVAAIALLALAFGGAYAAKSVAEGDLRDTFADEQDALDQRDAKRAIYDQFAAQETRELTLLQIGWAEIDYSDLATSVLAQVDEDSAFTELHFFGPSADGVGGASVEPLWGGGVGRFDFKAQTRSYEQAIALVARIEAVPGIAKVIATEQIYESEAPTLTWEVTGTGVVTPLALTRRLIPVDGVIDPASIDLILSGVGAATVVPSPEPTDEASGDASTEPTASADAESEG